jgi:tetratricopeptide (TPR) repeat protein
LEPLANVVSLRKDPKSGDYTYQARHSYIADIVFHNEVSERQARFDLMMRLIERLNPDYSYDREVIFHLVRARTIAEWFPDPQLGRALYDATEQSIGKLAGISHQRGLYEMRVAGDRSGLDRADRYFQEALRLEPTSRPIKHSLAELSLRRSEVARTDLESAAARTEAARIASALTSGSHNAYPFHTLAKVAIADLRDAMRAEEQDPSDLKTDAVSEAIKQAEDVIRSGLARFPNDSYLLSEEAELGDLLKNATRALRSLEKAFQHNPRSDLIANRLSMIHIAQGDVDAALSILTKAIHANPGSRILHYRYARAMMDRHPNADTANSDTILYHLQRSFSPGDRNLEAQFWYARQLWMMGRELEAQQIFDTFTQAKLPFESRSLNRGIVKDENGTSVRFYGQIIHLADTYGFIRQSAPSQRVFFRTGFGSDGLSLHLNDRVSYDLGFTLRGPIAEHLQRRSGDPEPGAFILRTEGRLTNDDFCPRFHRARCSTAASSVRPREPRCQPSIWCSRLR